MITRFTADKPRTLRGLMVIAAALLGAVVPVAAAPAASARTAPAAGSIARTAVPQAQVRSATPLPDRVSGPCVQAAVLAVQKRQLLKKADRFADAVDAVLRTQPHHRCSALVDYLRQTSA